MIRTQRRGGRPAYAAGRVVYDDGKLLRIREDPFSQRLSELAVNKIETRTLLNTSEMPEGLLKPS